jgi:hypothetical protein
MLSPIAAISFNGLLCGICSADVGLCRARWSRADDIIVCSERGTLYIVMLPEAYEECRVVLLYVVTLIKRRSHFFLFLYRALSTT